MATSRRAGYPSVESIARALLLSLIALAVCGCALGRKPVADAKKTEPAVANRPVTVEASAGPRDDWLPTPGADAASANREQISADAAAIEALRRKSEEYAAALEAMVHEQRGARSSSSARVDPADATAMEARSSDAVIEADHGAVSGGTSGAATVGAPDARKIAPTRGQPVVDNSNEPVALADVSDAPAVALVTPTRRPDGIAGDNTDAPVSGGIGSTRDTAAHATGLVEKLARRVKENPADVAAHLEYQLLLFLMDEAVPNLASIATLPQEDRELVTALLDGVANLRATLRRDSNLLIAEKIRPIVELSDRLRSTAELSIPTLTLCSRVEGYGRYEAMEARFVAGRESPTIVYCEIDNFSSQYVQQQWETNLSLELSLFSEMGQQVYVEEPVQITDTSRSRRHDFFLRKLVKLPSNLTIGRYVLKVTVVDTQSNRVAESSLPLQVVAQ